MFFALLDHFLGLLLCIRGLFERLFLLVWLYFLFTSLFLLNCWLSWPFSAFHLIFLLLFGLLLFDSLMKSISFLFHKLPGGKLLGYLIPKILAHKGQILMSLTIQYLRLRSGQHFGRIPTKQETMGKLIDHIVISFNFLLMLEMLLELFWWDSFKC